MRLKAGTGYNNMDHIDKKFLLPFHPLSNIKINKYFNSEPGFNGAFFKRYFTYNKIWSMS